MCEKWTNSEETYHCLGQKQQLKHPSKNVFWLFVNFFYSFPLLLFFVYNVCLQIVCVCELRKVLESFFLSFEYYMRRGECAFESSALPTSSQMQFACTRLLLGPSARVRHCINYSLTTTTRTTTRTTRTAI